MSTRREFLISFGTGLLLAAGGAVLAADDKAAASLSPSDVVRGFLAARAGHDSTGQYALFSAKVQAEIPFKQFDTQFAEQKDPLANVAKDGLSPIMVPLGVFFMDARAVLGYRFSVIGPDPGDPRTVLVRAVPPNIAPEKAFLIKIVTAPAAGGAPRIELLPSYEKTIPHDFAAMREPARRLTSLSNLKQIGLALIMYAQENGDRLPDADGWVDAILPQLGTEALFRDPTAPEEEPWNYAFNRALSGMRLSDIKDPAATVLVFESTTGVKNAADMGQSLPRPGRHAGGDCYVFADGHAKWLANGAKPSYAPASK